MSAIKNGVARCDDEPRAVYTHCYGHALNLAVNDMLKQCKTLKYCLETVNETIKLGKYSPKHDAEFQASCFIRKPRHLCTMSHKMDCLCIFVTKYFR